MILPLPWLARAKIQFAPFLRRFDVREIDETSPGRRGSQVARGFREHRVSVGGLELMGERCARTRIEPSGSAEVARVLCIDADPEVVGVVRRALRSREHVVVPARSLGVGLAVLGEDDIDLVVASQDLADGSGAQLLPAMRERGVERPLIITSPHTSIERAVAIVREGAVDYLTKPLRAEAVRIAVTHAIDLAHMRRVNEGYRSALRRTHTIIGRSEAWRRVLEVVTRVAPTRATVLLEGESGTGKELLARAIHDRSPRAAEAFVTVNCAALPEGLVESSLFGHERGAFTGAAGRALGAFERAHRGTLLLDEVSEMRLDLQGKLLRAIQEQEFERVGGQQPIRVDVRIVATTNRNLLLEVEAGRFRRDLYFRLHVVPIHTPALRERLEDLPLLVEHFIAKTAAEVGRRAPSITRAALERLARRPWLGNIRELANAVERAVILDRCGVLDTDSFEVAAVDEPGPPRDGSADPALSAGQAGESWWAEGLYDLRELERIAIRRALVATGGKRNAAAGLLGISDRTLRNKLKHGDASSPKRTNLPEAERVFGARDHDHPRAPRRARS
jgi:DNA-binding NtrC family response regulator